MKFIPILFQTLMVQATLQDRKTKTRRLNGLEIINKAPGDWLFEKFESNAKGGTSAVFTQQKDNDLHYSVPCPYGKKGDVLWGRETVYPRYVKGGYDGFRMQYPGEHPYKYYADDPKQSTAGNGWKPSIHMPKTACRIFLEITNIRVERLHDISEADAKAEGANNYLKTEDIECLKGLNWVIPRPFIEHQFGFLALWCKINGTQSWEANPWVWVTSFKKIERPVNFI